MKIAGKRTMLCYFLLCWGTIALMSGCATINIKQSLPFGPSEKIIVNQDKSYTVVTDKGLIKISPDGKIVKKEKWQLVGSISAVPYNSDVLVAGRIIFPQYNDNKIHLKTPGQRDKRTGFYYKLPGKNFKKFMDTTSFDRCEIVKIKDGYILVVIEDRDDEKHLLYYQLNNHFQIVGNAVAIDKYVEKLSVSQSSDSIYIAYIKDIPKQRDKKALPDSAYISALNVKNNTLHKHKVPTETFFLNNIAIYSDTNTIILCIKNMAKQNQYICYVLKPGNFALQATFKLIGKLPADTEDDYSAGAYDAAAITCYKNNYIIIYNKHYGVYSEHREQLEMAVVSPNGVLLEKTIIDPFEKSRYAEGHQTASNGDSLLITWHTLYKREKKYFWYILIKDRHNQKK